MISGLILTLNEQDNLPKCLSSLAWCDDVVVLDSLSTDRTVEIAKAAGARVVQRVFDNWAAHQNWAVENIGFRHSWVYYSDADEIIPPELRDEMLAVISSAAPDMAGYRLRYKNYFNGRWLKHCGIYPAWILRLFRPERVRWERSVNPVPKINGREGRLRNHFEHYSFAKGLSAWFEKHNGYSSGEAEEGLKALGNSRVPMGGLVSRDPAERRRALKELSFGMPCRPLLRFLYMYVVRLGFLDGAPGFHYCCLLSIYEYMIVLKMKEKTEMLKAENLKLKC